MSARSRAHAVLRRALLAAKSAAGAARATTRQGTPSHTRSQQMVNNNHDRIYQLHTALCAPSRVGRVTRGDFVVF